MNEHRVKSWPLLFDPTSKGLKTHDVRRADDRDYKVGDTLILQEFLPGEERYTGRELKTVITYITSAKMPCALSRDALNPDYVILSLAIVQP